jgi:hypothetical protein
MDTAMRLTQTIPSTVTVNGVPVAHFVLIGPSTGQNLPVAHRKCPYDLKNTSEPGNAAIYGESIFKIYREYVLERGKTL